MRPRHIPDQLRRARVLEPGWRFLWREVVARRPVQRTYRLRRSGQRVVLRHRTPDLGGLTEVFVNDDYAFGEDVLAALPAGRPVRVVDLGANIGLFGLKLLAARPDAQIVAVEPDPANARVLRETIEQNDAQPSWRVIEACAAAEDGVRSFVAGEYLTSRIGPGGIEVRAIDVFPLLEDADLIKIDIEGAERDLLADPRFASLEARVLYLEYHPPHSREEIVGLLRAAGFEPAPFTESHPGYADLHALRAPAG
jgi:FkbM family methyltransferase